jgi:putative FmdB family regulatory protein
MPIYEYQCEACRRDFELLVRSGEDVTCPHCGGRRLVKQFSVPAAHSASSRDLPICGAASPEQCGMGDCGSGGCPWQG